MLDGVEVEKPDARKRILIFAGATALTASAAALAIWLGAWAFDTRIDLQHQGRLQRLIEKKPLLEQVVAGLEVEGAQLVASPADPTALEAAARARAGVQAPLAIEKGRQYPIARVFLLADMIYFIYFDAEGVARDFVCVNRRRVEREGGAPH